MCPDTRPATAITRVIRTVKQKSPNALSGLWPYETFNKGKNSRIIMVIPLKTTEIFPVHVDQKSVVDILSLQRHLTHGL